MTAALRIQRPLEPGRGSIVAGMALCALLTAFTTGPAAAQDWLGASDLRGTFSSMFGGSPSYWNGFYFGGDYGHTSMKADFNNAVSGEIAYILRNTTVEDEFAPSNWTALPNKSVTGSSYGAFFGYNWQNDGLVLGFGLTYNHLSGTKAAASDAIARIVTTSDGYKHDLSIYGSSSVHLKDYATIRARAGYPIGRFLPYAFVGAAVGRFSYSSSATVIDDITPPSDPEYIVGPITETDGKGTAYEIGFASGLGVDVQLVPNVFLRGEWEYVAFAPLDHIKTYMNSFKGGVGVRF